MDGRAPRLFRWQARWALKSTFERPALEVVLRGADRHFVEPSPLAKRAAGRLNLRLAAYLLALRDSLLDSGLPADRAEALLAHGLYRVMRRVYLPTDALATALHPRDATARGRWRERLSRRLYFKPPDWLMDDVSTPGVYAFDVRRCVMAEFMEGRGEAPFCQAVICSQDLLMARGRGETLIRTQTIAGGADRCDFRFTGSEPRWSRGPIDPP